MNIVTLHEAKQRDEIRKPLWPIYSTFPHCSGPCGQGDSLCMTPEFCQTGDHQADDLEAVTLADDLWFWGGLAAALAVFIVCAAVMAGGRP
jgi:hypothetical protein